MPPLTWQNVAAPDFSNSIQALAQAGNMLDRGFASIAGGLGDYRDQAMQKASQQAMAKAAQITDVGAWDKAMQGGMGQALGVDPTMLTPDAMKFLEGYRTQLLGNADTQSGIASRDLYAANAAAQEARSAEQYKFDEPRRERDIKLQEGIAAAQLEGSKKAWATVLQDERIASAEEAKQQLANTIKDPNELEGALAAVDKFKDSRWKVDPNVQKSTEMEGIIAPTREGGGSTTIQDLRADIASKQQLRDLSDAADPGLNILQTAKANYKNNATAKDDLLKTWQARNGSQTTQDGGNAVATNAAAVSDAFDKIKENFKGTAITDGMIAAVLGSQMESSPTLWWDMNKVGPAVDKATAILKQMSTPAQLAALQSKSDARDRRNQGIQNIQVQLDRAVLMLEQARSSGKSQDVIDRYKAQVNNVADQWRKYLADHPDASIGVNQQNAMAAPTQQDRHWADTSPFWKWWTTDLIGQ